MMSNAKLRFAVRYSGNSLPRQTALQRLQPARRLLALPHLLQVAVRHSTMAQMSLTNSVKI